MGSYDNTQLDNPVMQVRHLIGDVYDFEFLSEAEIVFALDQNSGNVYKAAVDSCRAIVARLSRNTDYRFSTLWQDASQAVSHFKDLLQHLEHESLKRSSAVPLFHSTDDTEAVFDIGQFDNVPFDFSRKKEGFDR